MYKIWSKSSKPKKISNKHINRNFVKTKKQKQRNNNNKKKQSKLPQTWVLMYNFILKYIEKCIETNEMIHCTIKLKFKTFF